MLREEIFGASSLLVRCRDNDAVRRILGDLEGQLTITLHIADWDQDDAQALLALPAARLLSGFS